MSFDIDNWHLTLKRKNTLTPWYGRLKDENDPKLLPCLDFKTYYIRLWNPLSIWNVTTQPRRQLLSILHIKYYWIRHQSSKWHWQLTFDTKKERHISTEIIKYRTKNKNDYFGLRTNKIQLDKQNNQFTE